MQRSFTTFRATLVLGLAVILVACGGATGTTDTLPAPSQDQTTISAATPDDASGSSGPTDVCAMLTDEQVEEALGVPVTIAEPGGGQGFATGSCTWTLAKESPNDFNSFVVSVESPGGRSRFDILAADMPPIAGIGDAAYHQGDSIWAVSGDSLVVLDHAFLLSVVEDRVSAVLPLIETILAQL